MKCFEAILWVAMCAFLSVGCSQKKTDQSTMAKSVVNVDVLIAGQKKMKSVLEVNGTVLSNEKIELHPEISGRIIYLNMPDGALVKEGTILARINDSDLQAQLEQQKVQLDLAQKTEKRLSNLLKINGVNQADYDAALTQVNAISANIKVLNAQIDKTVIRAAFSGELGLRQVSLGAYVTPATLMGTLNQTDKIKIDFTVPETFAQGINKGDTVNLVSSSSKQTLKAVVSAAEPEINPTSRNIKVRALMSDGKVLHPGGFVKVLLDQTKVGIPVPTNAIIPDALSNQLIVIRNNKATFVNVETGVRTASLVEITGGIQEGDSIVVSGVLFVRPNGAVKVRKVSTIKDLK